MKHVIVVTAALCAAGVLGCAVEQHAGEEGAVARALSGPMPYRGVNLAGAEFGVASDGTGANPGTFGTHYIYPDPAFSSGYSADPFISKGMTTFRLPFRWERLQRTRRAAFDAAELSRLRTTVSRLTGKGAFVLLDPHNYARYGTALIGSSAVPDADFADFWSRLATEFKGNPSVLFGLMNEPYDLPTEQWVSSANAALAAIRATGATNLVLVPGNAWTGAHSWGQSWYGTANAVAMLQVRDPGNNVAFEVHQYLDSGFSGASSACVSTTTGADQLAGFTQWLRANGKRGFLGEFATGTSATCLTALDNLLSHLDANADVWLGWTWWAAGPWWGSDWTSLEPSSTGADKPQMAVLARHLGAAVTPTASCTDGAQNGAETGVDCGGACAACPVSGGACASTTWEAEAAFHSTGGATTGGWNLWTNGYLETASVAFPAVPSSLAVTARGTGAAGVWPLMRVSVGATTLGTVSVTSTAWAATRFSVPAGLVGPLRVTFTNDAVSGTEDRNLYVDKLALECGGATPSSCADTTYEAEAMTRSTGGATTGGWNLWSNGSVSTAHPFVAAPVRVVVTARGTPAGGVWPRMTVQVGGSVVGSATVSTSSWLEYGFDLTPPAGTAELRVGFDNDAVIGTEDRNLLLDKVVVRCR